MSRNRGRFICCSGWLPGSLRLRRGAVAEQVDVWTGAGVSCFFRNRDHLGRDGGVQELDEPCSPSVESSEKFVAGGDSHHLYPEGRADRKRGIFGRLEGDRWAEYVCCASGAVSVGDLDDKVALESMADPCGVVE